MSITFRRLTFIVLLFFVSACGTINRMQHPKIISIDSVPRGLTVSDLDGKEIGITPFFTQLNSSSFNTTKHLNFSFFDNKQNISETTSSQCFINWSGSIISNSLSSVIGGVVLPIVFLGFDLFKGTTTICKNNILHEFKQAIKKTNSPSVFKTILIPAGVSDPVLADKINNFFVEMMRDKPSYKNIKIIDLKRSKEALLIHGIDSYFSGDLKSIPTNSINSAAMKLKADYAIMFTSEVDKGKLHITPKLWDLHKREEVTTITFNSFFLKNYNQQSKLRKTFVNNFHILPNTLSLYYRPNLIVESTSSHPVFKGPNRFQTTKHPNAFPSFLGMLSLESLEHPRHYKIWDISYSFFTTLGTHSWKLDRFDNAAFIDSSQVIVYNILYNAGITGHTPIGAFSLNGGYGFAHSKYSDSLGINLTQNRAVSRFGFTYTAFLNERIAFSVKFEQLFFRTSIGNPDLGLINKINQTSVGLNYYYPEIKFLFSKI